ncbi:glycoside hydrolase family 28 protein [Desarmillaria tabescens]|uniref:galacturonan 1,4-alpha-galacturonidase n=1 Tax=Armillaria tabescens TaxID=1929756 RepID=A0AA39NPA0_ARMTA|nr:glycoside hydrolase family 28 protein [Desarmillaria tabescens]KAK0469205.1 glycoside hydrolase family 28 protein [Desarmillaria tabescens]
MYVFYVLYYVVLVPSLKEYRFCLAFYSPGRDRAGRLSKFYINFAVAAKRGTSMMLLLSLFAAVLLLAPHTVLGQDNCTLTASGEDDASQFLSAVQNCDTVVIPKNTTLNIATRLNMTGVSDTIINLEGTIRFDPDIPYWTGNAFYFEFQDSLTFWLLGGNNIVLNGGGTLDGAGQDWYDEFASNDTFGRPIILTVYQANSVVVEDIQMLNGPNWFNLIYESSNVTYSNISITAESTSDNAAKNTDGWDTYRSDTIVIKDSVIINGDDCVSFKPNSTNVLVSNLDCDGSHGISVGSLGQYAGVYDIVENAWAGPNVGSGIVKNITFVDFEVSDVDSPIVIDQCYFSEDECDGYPSNTYIQDVYFTNVYGTGSKSTVASLVCSPDGRCENINVNDLSLTAEKGTTTYECSNVVLTGNSADLFSCTEA